MVIGINQDGYRVEFADWRIHYGLTSTVGTLNGNGLPGVAFRCAVTLSAVSGHTDCAGSITIGSETLTFTAAGRKMTAVSLSALPVVSVSGLDCQVLIEAVTASGGPVLKETATALKCRFRASQKAYQDSTGAWKQSKAICDTTDSACDVGDVLRFGGVDYTIDQVECFPDAAGNEIYRRLYLK